MDLGSGIKLIHGDCLEEMKHIPDGSVDCVVCDLPYQITSCKWDKIIPLEDLWNLYNYKVKTNGAVILFGREPFTSNLILSNLKKLQTEAYMAKNKTYQCNECKKAIYELD